MFEVTEQKVLRWASERNILKGSTPLAQFKKTTEEVEELHDGLKAGIDVEIIDAIGDIMVTLAVIANMHSVNLDWCLHAAYQEIKDRKGQMVDGVFVKESK
jgi:NTP pyrophosphatase (non-canonical NTP hydrolase)